MNEPLLTKEEFLKKVSASEKILGASLKDFKDIDIDDFIKERNLTETSFSWYTTGRIKFKPTIELYIAKLKNRKIEAYLPQKLETANSTDEEYEKFKDEYFKSFKSMPNYICDYKFKFEDYEVKEGKETVRFMIGRTMYINQFLEQNAAWKLFENPCSFDYAWEKGASQMLPLYLSKTGKFFIAFWYGPYTVQPVKTFCEIE